jgi:peptidoglycan/LPS O-acetylase OafA/YrhL
MHVEFFFLGGLSYFLFRKLSHRERRLPLLPFAIMMAPLILFASGMAAESLPYIIWVGFFALLLDLQQKKVGAVIRAAAWLFENRLVCHLGKLSYSIYLSHFLVITLCQFALVQLLPALPHHQHVLLLGLLVLCATVGISQMLHRLIELPGMRLGRRLADSMDQKPAEKALPG